MPAIVPTSVQARQEQRWLFLLVMALALIIAGCDGPTFGNTPQQQGAQPTNGAPSATCNIPLFEQVRLSTAQQDGKVLFASYATDTTFTQQVVVALNPLTQQQLWQHPFSVNANAATRLTAADGIVYALFLHTNSDQSWLFALDAHTGQQLWTYHEDDADDLAVCYGTLVLVGNVSVHVFAAKTGKMLWTYQQFAQTERLGSTLAMTSDTIYLMTLSRGGDEQATARALNLQDGKERWQVLLPPEQDFGTTGSLALTEQALYVLQAPLEGQGHLLALRPQDGSQIWSASSADYEKILMASNDTLYLANPWQVDAFQTSNGKHLWSQRFEETANIVIGTAQHGIFESQQGASFCSLDLTNGTNRWCLSLRLLGWDGTPFFVDNTTIYLLSQGSEHQLDDNHELYLVDAQTGKVRQMLNIHPLIGAITTL